jgi:ABC-type bacteriocin/lantibiotic exporter with double-glycine peptidase domain
MDNTLHYFVVVARYLGTPCEATWPGVTRMENYSPDIFPQWSPVPLSCRYWTNLSTEGVELLEVRLTGTISGFFSSVIIMVFYDRHCFYLSPTVLVHVVVLVLMALFCLVRACSKCIRLTAFQPWKS